jgi:hypothetical protein
MGVAMKNQEKLENLIKQLEQTVKDLRLENCSVPNEIERIARQELTPIANALKDLAYDIKSSEVAS